MQKIIKLVYGKALSRNLGNGEKKINNL